VLNQPLSSEIGLTQLMKIITMRVFLTFFVLISSALTVSGCSTYPISADPINESCNKILGKKTAAEICKKNNGNWAGVAKLSSYIEAKNIKSSLQHQNTSPFCRPLERTELDYVVDDKKFVVTCFSQTHKNLATPSPFVSFDSSYISGYVQVTCFEESEPVHSFC